MKYISTRNQNKNENLVSSAEAIKKGLAPDGGLYMPTEIPELSLEAVASLAKLPYEERATEILSMFLTDYDKEKLALDCRTAYGEDRFQGGAAPLVKVTDTHFSLELWHGPTCAFKDMALQIMPRLLSRALVMTEETRKAHILVATSGDTGKAALEGYRDVDGIDITVFYPVDGVSPMQKLQMATQLGENVNVCAVYGNFDDAQNGVKRIFSDKALANKAEDAGFFFSSANSINWGRLAPQIVYYVSAYCDLLNAGEISLGDKINVCVPTGNFGNIFAGYIAREMGLPIDKMICASNANCVLTDFIRGGTYDRTREFFKTMSPSMDILISSNLERLLWLLAGPEETARCMAELSANGKYTVSEEILAKLQSVFYGYCSTEEETAACLKDTFENKKYLADTHTSVAIDCYNKYVSDTGDMTKTVVVSTASPYKFPYDVCSSIGKTPENEEPAYLLGLLEELSGTKAPAALSATLSLPVRFKQVVAAPEMETVIF
ncbi:MAG: threonine synthase [Ruminococcaceae bacterium]|nr:threonine synthase [Oscillospiraceae bacterium]